MRVAPLGAFGAVAFTVGKFGLGTLLALGKLVAAFYLACGLFVLVVLGVALRWTGLGLFRFLRYIRQEVLITVGTSSSESALPLLMEKMGRLGCSRPVVGFVTPLGYSFNLTGTAIYLTLATVFIAQATATQISIVKGIEILAVLLVTSKTAAAVTGGGFIALAATLTAVGDVPVVGLTLLLGIDRIMSEARAVTNPVERGFVPRRNAPTAGDKPPPYDNGLTGSDHRHDSPATWAGRRRGCEGCERTPRSAST